MVRIAHAEKTLDLNKMPNRNYKNGAKKEQRFAKKLRDVDGYSIAQRSAGSHSPVDIWAIHKEKKQIRLIQCKPKNYSKTKTETLLMENEWLNGTFEVSFEVI